MINNNSPVNDYHLKTIDALAERRLRAKDNSLAKEDSKKVFIKSLTSIALAAGSTKEIEEISHIFHRQGITAISEEIINIVKTNLAN